MSIKETLTQTVQALESEKNQKILEIKQRIIPEKIAPYNESVDSARDKAIMEKREQAEKDIEKIKQHYAEEKLEIEKAAEEDKKKNEDSVVMSETYDVQKKYDKTLFKLKEQIQELEE